jgi:hypothetical protein
MMEYYLEVLGIPQIDGKSPNTQLEMGTKSTWSNEKTLIPRLLDGLDKDSTCVGT